MSELKDNINDQVKKVVPVDTSTASKVLPANSIWKMIVIAVCGLLAVVALLFLSFVAKSVIYFAIFAIIIAVAVIIGIGAYKLQNKKKQ